MGIVTVLSVVLNLFLISKFQAIGASLTVLATNILMFVLGIYWVGKIIDYRKGKIFLVFLKSFLAASAMGGLVLYLKPLVNILALVPAAGIIYFILLFLLGGFKKEDIISITESFFSKSKNLSKSV